MQIEVKGEPSTDAIDVTHVEIVSRPDTAALDLLLAPALAHATVSSLLHSSHGSEPPSSFRSSRDWFVQLVSRAVLLPEDPGNVTHVQDMLTYRPIPPPETATNAEARCDALLLEGQRSFPESKSDANVHRMIASVLAIDKRSSSIQWHHSQRVVAAWSHVLHDVLKGYLDHIKVARLERERIRSLAGQLESDMRDRVLDGELDADIVSVLRQHESIRSLLPELNPAPDVNVALDACAVYSHSAKGTTEAAVVSSSPTAAGVSPTLERNEAIMETHMSNLRNVVHRRGVERRARDILEQTVRDLEAKHLLLLEGRFGGKKLVSSQLPELQQVERGESKKVEDELSRLAEERHAALQSVMQLQFDCTLTVRKWISDLMACADAALEHRKAQEQVDTFSACATSLHLINTAVGQLVA